MKAFDLHRMAFDKVPFDFLGEVALRSLYTFVLVFLFLKMTGRRGVRQMSLFEVLIILTLGSAAGDVAFYDDVPIDGPGTYRLYYSGVVIPPGNVVDGAQ